MPPRKYGRRPPRGRGNTRPSGRSSQPPPPSTFDDNSSVDSHGNIRDLIAYDSDTSEQKRTHRPKRKAATKALDAIKKRARMAQSIEETDDSSDEDYVEESNVEGGEGEDEDEGVKEDEGEDDEDEDEEDDEEDDDDNDEDDDEEDDDDNDEDEDEDEKDEDEEDDDEEDDDEEDDDEEDDDDEEEEEGSRRRPSARIGGIELLISDLAAASISKKPKKYKLNKEPENVRRFVKLIQTNTDPDEEDIDRDITYFKSLDPALQDRLLQKLQTKATPPEPSVPLKFQILTKEVQPEIERIAMAKYTALQNIDPSTTEYFKTHQWIHGYTQLPLGVYRDLPVRLDDGVEACQAFMTSVHKHMDSAIFGHDDAKLQIMQFVSSWIANPSASGNVLSVYGPPGVGKTTLIKDGVAKALGRPFHFITLGGATDASYLDGHSYTYEGSVWGRIVDALIKSRCMNPVFYFDELDKVSETPKGEEINNLLVHITDQSQNDRFQDKYFAGIDLDLSRCLFIFSHNAHERINPILKDRMYNVHVKGFDMKQKLVIAEQYLVPAALREANLTGQITFSKDIMTYMIAHFTGEESGVRELKRCIQTIISKLNLLRFYNDPARVPFAIKGFSLPFVPSRDHIDQLLRKKPVLDPSISHLYV
jgi:hypothetical protein